jgi:hypothetical protein
MRIEDGHTVPLEYATKTDLQTLQHILTSQTQLNARSLAIQAATLNNISTRMMNIDQTHNVIFPGVSTKLLKPWTFVEWYPTADFLITLGWISSDASVDSYFKVLSGPTPTDIIVKFILPGQKVETIKSYAAQSAVTVVKLLFSPIEAKLFGNGQLLGTLPLTTPIVGATLSSDQTIFVQKYSPYA